MLQQEANKRPEIVLPARDSKIKLTPEEMEAVKMAADKSCLCHDAATFSWSNPCTPASL
ncbi:hypothetical protein G6O69_20165 [Pseudenhygromyxa sp. WMMC2535]|uniref:hypothetical protein n=1 Tax=Pseudenhygromyxa sp. WMMC2535 TaxID=2712867 RepID=UPI001552BAE3|nr:hypothetical protein [Pseudenhygromyxa sp. WMMC2535]NVB40173.1 hypothetical protein [Pseudenhygromyxa sp. WMMC2535]